MQKLFTTILRTSLAAAAITLAVGLMTLPKTFVRPVHAQRSCICCADAPCGLCSYDCGVCTGGGTCSH